MCSAWTSAEEEWGGWRSRVGPAWDQPTLVGYALKKAFCVSIFVPCKGESVKLVVQLLHTCPGFCLGAVLCRTAAAAQKEKGLDLVTWLNFTC